MNQDELTGFAEKFKWWRRSGVLSWRLAGAVGPLASAAMFAGLVGPIVSDAGANDQQAPSEEAASPFDPLSEPSALAGFRSYTDEPARDDRIVAVQGLPPGQRVRIAMMDDYDGEVWRGSGSGTPLAGEYLPVDAELPAELDTDPVDLVFEVHQPQGVWLPLAGDVRTLGFDGPDAGSLEEEVVVSAGSDTAAIPSGVPVGVEYRISAAFPDVPGADALAELPLDERFAGFESDTDLPEEIVALASEWSGGVPTPFGEVAAIAEKLRTEGHYSDGAGDAQPASPPGHSLERMVEFLEPAHPVGNGEQFASALALMAQARGVPVRVVVGFVNRSDGSDRTFEGSDIEAWVEVPLEGVGWVPVDGTPPRDQVTEAVVQPASLSENLESAPSSPVTTPLPTAAGDVIPDAPAAPTVVWGDRTMDVSWTAPQNEGSPITEYTLTNVTTGESRSLGASVRSSLWIGLENGTCYRFTLIATNGLGRSDVSPQSTGDREECRPAGPPKGLGAPTVNDEPAGAPQGVLEVSWSANDSTNGNGDEIDQFRVTGTGSGGPTVTELVSASRREQRFDVPNGVDYTFRVEAENKAGWSDPSGPSASARADDVPDRITSVNLDLGGRTAGSATINFAAPADNGATIDRYNYRLSDGTVGTTSPGGVIAVPTCQSVSAQVWAHNSDGDAPESPASNSVQSYNNPSASVTGAEKSVVDANASWSWSTDNGCGGASIPGVSVSVAATDKHGTSGAASGSRNVTLVEGESSGVSVSITTLGPRGLLNASDTDSVSRQAPPPQPVTLGGDAPRGEAACTNPGCGWPEPPTPPARIKTPSPAPAPATATATAPATQPMMVTATPVHADATPAQDDRVVDRLIVDMSQRPLASS